MSNPNMPRGALPPRISRSRMPRGAVPSPRHELAGARPYEAVGSTPPTCLYLPRELSFWGNSTYGDCVTAEEAFAKACHTPEIFITESEAVTWARDHGFLNGAVLIDVLRAMTSDGFRQNGHTFDDGPAISVNWTNGPLLQNAIAQGPVKIGIAADQLDTVYSAHPSNGWFATGFHPDHQEDHCVSLCGYGSVAWLANQLQVPVPQNANGAEVAYAMFTWDTVGIIELRSMLAITHEAWLRTPTTKIV